MAAFINITSAPDTSGPIVATFPALTPSDTTTFTSYADFGGQDAPSTGGLDHRSLLAGRNQDVDFISVNRDAASTSTGAFSEYVVAVYDKHSKKIAIRGAPLYIMSREVKRLHRRLASDGAVAKRIHARSVLGQAFGSKKSRAAIQAAERNRVDVSAMNDIAHHLQDDINVNTRTLPQLNDSEREGDSRPGPSPNMDANEPENVYTISAFVPESELKTCPIRNLVATKEEDRSRILPYGRSTWINSHIDFLLQQTSLDKYRLRLLYHISCMLGFREAATRGGELDAVRSKMVRIPPVVQEGLWSRYSEAARSSQHNRITSEMDVKLLAHMFVLCLVVDNFSADIIALANDLHLPLPRVTKIFQALGCKIEVPSLADRNALGLAQAPLPDKRAFLRVPLTFPKVRQGRQRP